MLSSVRRPRSRVAVKPALVVKAVSPPLSFEEFPVEAGEGDKPVAPALPEDAHALVLENGQIGVSSLLLQSRDRPLLGKRLAFIVTDAHHQIGPAVTILWAGPQDAVAVIPGRLERISPDGTA